MDYRIADFLIRIEGNHSDIVACGLQSFKPFEIETDNSATPAMILRMESIIDDEQYPPTKILHNSVFEQSYATGELSRYATGYKFKMVHEQKSLILIKEDGSNIVESNLGCFEKFDATLARFGLWIMFGIVIAPLGGIAIHSSVVVKEGKAVLCLGESGTGKSTHTRLWRENIEGARLLNDDSPFIGFSGKQPMVYGSPWSGKTPCYKDEKYPLRAIVRLSQAPHNKIRRLKGAEAIGALLPSLPPAFAYDGRLKELMFDILSGVLSKAEIYHLECLPNADAARLVQETLFKI